MQYTLYTTECELNLEKSKRTVDSVAQDENIRKLRLQLLLLEDENEDLHDQLQLEQDRGDALEAEADDVRVHADELEAGIVRATMELKLKAKELDNTRVRLARKSQGPPHHADRLHRRRYWRWRTRPATRQSY